MAFGFGINPQTLLDGVGGAGGGASALDKVLEILGSKGGQTAVNAIGAGLSAYGQNKQAEADRAQTANQFKANILQRQMEGDRDAQAQAAYQSAALSPLGEAQQFAQRNALASAILPGLRNFQATPGDPRVAKAMGKVTGGFRIPEGGFDPAMIQRVFGDSATLESIKQRAGQIGQINPSAPVMDLSPMYGEAGGAATSLLQQANKTQLDQQLAEQQRQRELIMRAIDEDIKGEKQKKKNKAGSALGGAASGALTGASIGSIVPGLGTGVGAAIGGIGGFLKGLF